MNSPSNCEDTAERRFRTMVPALRKLNAETTRPDQLINALVGLGMELVHSFRELDSGVRARIVARAALGARNLLELRYWTSFAAISEDNIYKLRKEALIDYREILDKFTATCKANPELVVALPCIQQGRQAFEDLCKQSGETADGTSRRTANIAQSLVWETNSGQ